MFGDCMDIKNLSNSEKIELINQLLKDVLETESVSALELDAESILIKIWSKEIIDNVLFCGVILDSDLDNEIWWKTDELGGDIKGHIYDYAYENGIKINDI